MERQRLDKWLWHARVVKARTSAAALVEAGHVRINGVREKAPGHAVKAGDVLTVGLDRSVRILKIVGFSERRGDASAARRSMMICRIAASDYLCGLNSAGGNALGKSHFGTALLPLRLWTSCATQTPQN